MGFFGLMPNLKYYDRYHYLVSLQINSSLFGHCSFVVFTPVCSGCCVCVFACHLFDDLLYYSVCFASAMEKKHLLPCHIKLECLGHLWQVLALRLCLKGEVNSSD